MNKRSKITCGVIAAAISITVAATAYANVGVGASAMNGVKNAVRSDGSLKPNAVGHLQLKNHVVSCEKMTWDLKNALCKGALAKAGANGVDGANGVNGANGAAGANGADGAAGVNGKDGARGEQGIQGEQGPQGPAGQDGHSVFASSYVNQASFWVPAGGHNDVNVWCNTGDLATGGGFSFSLNEQGFSRVLQSRMTWSQAAQDAAIAQGKAADANPDGWYVEATGGSDNAKGYAWVMCIAS